MLLGQTVEEVMRHCDPKTELESFLVEALNTEEIVPISKDICHECVIWDNSYSDLEYGLYNARDELQILEEYVESKNTKFKKDILKLIQDVRSSLEPL